MLLQQATVQVNRYKSSVWHPVITLASVSRSGVLGVRPASSDADSAGSCDKSGAELLRRRRADWAVREPSEPPRPRPWARVSTSCSALVLLGRRRASEISDGAG